MHGTIIEGYNPGMVVHFFNFYETDQYVYIADSVEPMQCMFTSLFGKIKLKVPLLVFKTKRFSNGKTAIHNSTLNN